MKTDYMNEKELESLSGNHFGFFATKVGVWLGLMVLGGYLALQDSILMMAGGTVLIALMFVHGVELVHQALHGSGFKSHTVSRIVGFLLGAPMLVSFRSYQFSHLMHHQKVGTPDDTEFFEFNTLTDNASFFTKLMSFMMAAHYKIFFQRLVKSLMGKDILEHVPAKIQSEIRSEYKIMGLAIVVAVALSIAFQSWLIVQLWLVPLVLIAGPVHTMVEFPEHYGCNNESPDITQNTRSIRASWIMVWFTNGNNYHVEHHMYPMVRPENLKKVHKVLQPHIKYQDDSYFNFFKSMKSSSYENTQDAV